MPDKPAAPDDSDVHDASGVLAASESVPLGVPDAPCAADAPDESEAGAPAAPASLVAPYVPDDSPLPAAEVAVDGSCGIVWGDPAAIPDERAESGEVCAEG